MGGRGSGRSAGYGFGVDKCEEYQNIDLAWLRGEKMLKVGNSGSIQWSRRGEVYSSVGYRVETNGLRLIYRTRVREGEWRDVDELIRFTSTPTQFGGQRIWYVCPCCQKRCRVIYGGSHFRCRTCHGLRYESQYENATSRIASQRHKLRRRLGYVGSLEDPFPLKPKRMHWTTSERLQERDAELERRWVIGVAA